MRADDQALTKKPFAICFEMNSIDGPILMLQTMY